MKTDLPPPYLIADDPGIEVLNSVGAPYGETVDWVQDGKELLAWMVAVELLTPDQSQQIDALLPEKALDKAAQDVRALREQFRAIVPHSSPEFLLKLNQLLSKGRGFYELVAEDGQAPVLRLIQRVKTGDDLVSLCAAAIAQLLSQGEPERTRKCGNPACTYWFRDVSKNNRRRWCSMAVCGNRAKAAAHRAKVKQQKGFR